jgi:D-lactate dehydrogenase
MMKPGSILLNVSRGGLVDSQALYDGLENGQLGGLGMDVYENEGEALAVHAICHLHVLLVI